MIYDDKTGIAYPIPVNHDWKEKDFIQAIKEFRVENPDYDEDFITQFEEDWGHKPLEKMKVQLWFTC